MTYKLKVKRSDGESILYLERTRRTSWSSRRFPPADDHRAQVESK